MSKRKRKAPKSFNVLIVHLLGSFVGGDLAVTRLLQLSVALVLPPLLYVLSALPSYSGLMPMFKLRPMRMQVADHFVLITYAYCICGLATLLAWERFFPTIQDLRIIGILPIARRRLFAARLCASMIFLALLLIVPNAFPGLLLVGGAGSKHAFLQLLAQAASLMFAGLFASSSVLLLLLMSRVHALLEACMQALLIAVHMFILLFSPVLSGQAINFIRLPAGMIRLLPQVWFTALYETIWQAGNVAPATLILARIGVIAAAVAIAVAGMLYPVAYWYQERRLMEGRGAAAKPNGRFLAMPVFMQRIFLPRPPQLAGCALAASTILRVNAFRTTVILMLTAAAALACSFHSRGSLFPDASVLGIFSVCLVSCGVFAVFASRYEPRAAWIFETATDEARQGVFHGARFMLVVAALLGGVTNLAVLLCLRRSHSSAAIWSFALIVPVALLVASFLFHHNEFLPFTQERLLRQQTLRRLATTVIILMPLCVLALHRWYIAASLLLATIFIIQSQYEADYGEIPDNDGPQRLNLDGMSP